MTQIAPIDLITASAGTGKTHRLAEEFLSRLDGEVGPGAVLATTFTRKAAAELLERVRQHLIAAGRTEEAQLALGGYIGTVNAVFGRLAGEFALEAGRSPVAEVIPEDRVDALFAVAAEAAIVRYTDRVDPPARRLGQEDWRGTLRRLVALARQNDIAPDAFPAAAQRSWHGLAAYLPMAAADGEALDRTLHRAVTDAVTAIEGGTDATKETAKALETLREAARDLSDGGSRLAWAEWARLAKLKTGKLSRAIAETVSKAASVHPSHPRLHADLRTFIEGLFHCAAEALDQYAAFKAARGLVDFVDQEQAALALFDRPAVADVLAERLAVALVDEVQDTSPIQLALFLKLARLVRHSVWVGDPKQSIYGFRGTDPELIQAVVARIVPATGGRTERLTKSWRARPGLVSFVNDLFAAAFPPHGIPAEDVRILACARTDLPGQQAPLAVWTLDGKTIAAAAAAPSPPGSLIFWPSRRRIRWR